MAFYFPRMRAALLVLTMSVAGVAAAGQRSSEGVEMSISRVSVANALSDLGSEAGVSLSAERQLGLRPFQMFIRNQHLGAVLPQVAEVLSTPPGTCLWLKGAAGVRPAYRLVEDIRSGQERQALLLRSKDARRQRLQEDVNTAVSLAQMTPEQLTEARKRHPELGYWIPALRSSLALLGTLSPEQARQLTSGQGISLPYSKLSPEQQDLLRKAAGRRMMRGTLRRPDGTSVVVEWRSPEDLPKTTLTFRISGSPDRPGIRVYIPTVAGSGMGWPDVLHPPRLGERAQPEWMKEALKSKSDERVRRRRALEQQAAKNPGLRTKVTVRAFIDVRDPKDPKRGQKRAADLSACLLQIADRTGLSVLGDYDPCWDDYYSPGVRTPRVLAQDLIDWPLWRVLDFIEEHFDISLQKKGKFIQVRSPRVLFAELDGIDLLDDRRAPPARIPELERDVGNRGTKPKATNPGSGNGRTPGDGS